MQRTPLVLVAIFMFSSFATSVGQESKDQPLATQQEESTFRKVEGCLAYNGVSYVLAVVSNGPKQYRVTGGDVAALKGKVGHTVEIDGPTGPNNPQAMIENWDQREATTGVGWYAITADRVHDVTSNCSYPGFEHPLSHVQMD